MQLEPSIGEHNIGPVTVRHPIHGSEATTRGIGGVVHFLIFLLTSGRKNHGLRKTFGGFFWFIVVGHSGIQLYSIPNRAIRSNSTRGEDDMQRLHQDSSPDAEYKSKAELSNRRWWNTYFDKNIGEVRFDSIRPVLVEFTPLFPWLPCVENSEDKFYLRETHFIPSNFNFIFLHQCHAASLVHGASLC